jgi:hypothetical protein
LSDALAVRPPAEVAKNGPVEQLRERYNKLQRSDLNIAQLMDRFAELPSFVEKTAREELVALLVDGTDEQIHAKYGFKNKKELRIALYGTLPKKDWPASMQAAHERVLARTRKMDRDKTRNVLNVNLINIPAPQPPGPERKIIEIVDKEPPK